MKRLPCSNGVRCSATLVRDGRCKARYADFARPQLCNRHHRVLRRHLALFNEPPKFWTELRPRDWRTGELGLVALGPGETLRFLAGVDREPLELGAGGGLTGVYSGARFDEAIVVEQAGMASLRWFALDRPDLERALRKAAKMRIGERLQGVA
jgi:hypothetical protein